LIRWIEREALCGLCATLDHRVIALVIGVLEVQQRHPQVERQQRAPSLADPCNQLDRLADPVDIADAHGGRVKTPRCRRPLDIVPEVLSIRSTPPDPCS
jgi:hypothetical protein